MTCNCTNDTFIQLLKDFEKTSDINDDAGDAAWILTSAFIIFTMQSGFGLLEAGSCSLKNECNIMIKNAVDVIFGALGYYICGFAFSFGQDVNYSNAFTGFGYFVPTVDDGHLYAKYFFQLSFATTATTIVSGAMAERTNLKAYIVFSFLNFFSYVFPAHWTWDDKGFLRVLGVVDIAGCGPVHIVGGVSAMIATLMLKPRIGIFNKDCPKQYHMASPTNAMLGTFMLWWGWLGFNCGSIYGVSGGKWKLASKSAVVTINGSVGGGIFAIIYSYYLTKQFNGKLDVGILTTGILAGLVSITSISAVCKPWEGIVIGFIGGIISAYGANLMVYLKIDDPVSVVPVHFFCGLWGLICVGLFGEKGPDEYFSLYNGLFKGGTWAFLGVQLASCVCITLWAAIATAVELFVADKMIGLRMSHKNELLGADITEHGIVSHILSPVVANKEEKKPSILQRVSLHKLSTENKVQNGNFYDEGVDNFGYDTVENIKSENHNTENTSNMNMMNTKLEHKIQWSFKTKQNS